MFFECFFVIILLSPLKGDDIMKDIKIKFDELVPRAAELTVKETENELNYSASEEETEVEDFMRKNTEDFLNHYEEVFRKNLHDLVMVSVNEQLNE